MSTVPGWAVMLLLWAGTLAYVYLFITGVDYLNERHDDDDD